jgi:hypothetical protein
MRGILSRLFGSNDNRKHDYEKQKKFSEFERSYAGDYEMINNAKAVWLTSCGSYYGERGHSESFTAMNTTLPPKMSIRLLKKRWMHFNLSLGRDHFFMLLSPVTYSSQRTNL